METLPTLQKYWGFDKLKSKQIKVIDSILKGNDTIALLTLSYTFVKSIAFSTL